MTRIPDDARDRIHIRELELTARIGVPDEERAKPQRLTVSITLWPKVGFHAVADALEKTVNYASVCEEVKGLVAGRSDKLVETLGEVIAAHLLQRFPIFRVRLELRKFILPDVRYVAVELTREQPAAS
jgi:dihydroneopterin aldolase